VRPTQPVKIFGNVFTPFCTLPSGDLHATFTEIFPGEPVRRELNPCFINIAIFQSRIKYAVITVMMIHLITPNLRNRITAPFKRINH